MYSCAGDRQQAAIVFSVAAEMVRMEPEFACRVNIYRDRLQVPSTGSVYRVLSAEGPLQQGLWPSMVVFDELFNQPNDLLWSAMSMGMAGRERPLLVGITTPGWNIESLAYRLFSYGRAITTGAEPPDPSFCFVEFSAPQDCDHLDPKNWKRANPGLGDLLTVEEVAAEARVTPEAEFRQLRLGQWTAGSSAWLPFGAWAKRADPGRVVERGAPVVLAFDGSYSGDASAIVAATIEEHPHVWPVGIWQNERDPGWRVPRDEVSAVLADAMAYFEVRETSVDPFGWASEIAAWEQAYGEVVVSFPTNQPPRMGPACDLFYELVMEGRLTHSGDARLAAHVANCVTRRTTYGNLIVKSHKSSPRRIDAAVAAVVAVSRARWHVANPPKRRRVYAF